jgi:hypothetical protein
MGAKTWMLAYADGKVGEILKSKPSLNRVATAALVKQLFPSETLKPMNDGSLYDTCPPDDEIYAGCFSGLSILAANEFGLDYPSRLSARFLAAKPNGTVYLHAMHSAVDWFAFAIWKDGKLQRSLSLSPRSGILEDIGSKLAFEEPFWSGQHPASDPDDDEDCDYPFSFHPLELGGAALLELFGYQLEGIFDSNSLLPETIPLAGFKRVKSRWKLW